MVLSFSKESCGLEYMDTSDSKGRGKLLGGGLLFRMDGGLVGGVRGGGRGGGVGIRAFVLMVGSGDEGVVFWAITDFLGALAPVLWWWDPCRSISALRRSGKAMTCSVGRRARVGLREGKRRRREASGLVLGEGVGDLELLIALGDAAVSSRAGS